MPSPVFLSRPRPGINIWAIVRGAQLTFLGAYRALKNPQLFDSKFYSAAFYIAVVCFFLQIICLIPIYLSRAFLAIGSWIFVGDIPVHKPILDSVLFFQNVILDLPGAMTVIIRLFYPHLLDEVFIASLQVVDDQYNKNHPAHKLFYAPSLLTKSPSGSNGNKAKTERILRYARQHTFRAALAFIIYNLSSAPYVGPFVVPVVTMINVNRIAGLETTAIIAIMSAFMSRKLSITMLSSFFGARSCSRRLLEPYFSRVPTLTTRDREAWFSRREGILLGFGFSFFWLLRVPYLGIFAYGFAQASTAYLITKITTPLPMNQSEIPTWIQSQI